MSDYSERKLLRRLQAISEIEPGGESTDRAIEKARGAIDSVDYSKIRSRSAGRSNRIVWYAAAVLLLAVAITAVIVWTNGGDDNTTVVKEPAPKEEIKQEPVKDETPVVKETPEVNDEFLRPEIEKQLKLIAAMADDGDVDGLIVILQEGEFAVKLIVASYLMKIGDERAIEPLEKLSDEWYNDTEANPFRVVIEAITDRIAANKDAKGGEDKPGDKTTTTGAAVAKGGAIEGIVLDDSGAAVAGASVSVISSEGAAVDPNGVLLSQAVLTDGDGRFVLEGVAPGSVTVKASHENYNSVTVSGISVASEQVTAGVEFVLVGGGAVEGVVYDGAGAPEANVTLYFQDALTYNGPDEMGRVATVVTDEKGYYSVVGLDEQMCYIKRADEKQRPGVVRCAVLPVSGKTVRLNLGGGAVVSGAIVIDGQPLANVQVLLSDPFSAIPRIFGCYGMTDSDGRFSLSASGAGRYGVYYSRGGYPEQWTTAGTVEVGGADVDMGLISQATGSVSVFVEAADPNDITDSISVYLQQGHGLRGGRFIQAAEPAESGQPYVLSNVPPGEYTAVVFGYDKRYYRHRLVYDAAVQEDIKLAIDVSSGTSGVSGHYTSRWKQQLMLVNTAGTFAYRMTHYESGDYEIPSLRPDSYVVCSDLYGPEAGLLDFTVADNEHKLIDIDTADWSQMGKTAVWVQAVSDDGLPVIGADIRLHGFPGEIAPIQQTGAASLFVVDVGEYTVTGDFGGFVEAVESLVLEANEITAPRDDRQIVFIQLKRQ